MSKETDKIESALERDREHLKDTVHELQERMTPGRMMDELLAVMKGGPADFANTLGQQLRDKPLPAVLTGVGLTWMMLSDRHSPKPDGGNGSNGSHQYPSAEELEGHAAWERYQTASWNCVRENDEDDEKYQNRLTAERAKAANIQRRDDESDNAFRERVEGASHNLQANADKTRKKLSSAYEGAISGVAHAASAGVHAMSSGAASVRDAARSATSGAKYFYEDHPLASGAVGLALGAMIGSALPLSRGEYDSLKGLVDDGLERGAAAASKMAEKVEQGASLAEEAMADKEYLPSQ